MKSKLKKGLIKGLVSLLLIFMLILSSVVATWAEELEGLEEFPTADISPWALITLNEGERYGIYPTDWYYDGFREEISEERLEILLENTLNKIRALGLEENENFTPIPSKGNRTREDILIIYQRNSKIGI
ncbi:MAG: hypothetical protein GXZ06_04690 [Tissierellia bacterium]|nr:hypothetical protein [Tissierellia bacterium]